MCVKRTPTVPSHTRDQFKAVEQQSSTMLLQLRIAAPASVTNTVKKMRTQSTANIGTGSTFIDLHSSSSKCSDSPPLQVVRHGAAVSRPPLTKDQQAAFKQWLEEYRKKWVAYWNYLSNAVMTHIVTEVPVTWAELAVIPGFGASKALLYGEGILATIYAFLESQDLLYLFPHASLPILPECPTWRSPFSEEAEILRMHMIEQDVVPAHGGAEVQQHLQRPAIVQPKHPPAGTQIRLPFRPTDGTLAAGGAPGAPKSQSSKRPVQHSIMATVEDQNQEPTGKKVKVEHVLG